MFLFAKDNYCFHMPEITCFDCMLPTFIFATFIRFKLEHSQNQEKIDFQNTLQQILVLYLLWLIFKGNEIKTVFKKFSLLNFKICMDTILCNLFTFWFSYLLVLAEFGGCRNVFNDILAKVLTFLWITNISMCK